VSHITLTLLGHPRIEINSIEVTVDTRKAVALIAYLAVTGQRQSRDTSGLITARRTPARPFAAPSLL
jgi:hypothetical protein